MTSYRKQLSAPPPFPSFELSTKQTEQLLKLIGRDDPAAKEFVAELQWDIAFAYQERSAKQPSHRAEACEKLANRADELARLMDESDSSPFIWSRMQSVRHAFRLPDVLGEYAAMCNAFANDIRNGLLHVPASPRVHLAIHIADGMREILHLKPTMTVNLDHVDGPAGNEKGLGLFARLLRFAIQAREGDSVYVETYKGLTKPERRQKLSRGALQRLCKNAVTLTRSETILSATHR